MKQRIFFTVIIVLVIAFYTGAQFEVQAASDKENLASDRVMPETAQLRVMEPIPPYNPGCSSKGCEAVFSHCSCSWTCTEKTDGPRIDCARACPIEEDQKKPQCSCVNGRCSIPSVKACDEDFDCPQTSCAYIEGQDNNCPMTRCVDGQCKICTRECRNVGSRSEGWYDSCTGELIKWANCGEITDNTDKSILVPSRFSMKEKETRGIDSTDYSLQVVSVTNNEPCGREFCPIPSNYAVIEISSPGGCGVGADPRCLGPPAFKKQMKMGVGLTEQIRNWELRLVRVEDGIAYLSIIKIGAQEPGVDSGTVNQECSIDKPCPEGLECIGFPTGGLRCAKPDPCSYFECPSGQDCVVMESYPQRVSCSGRNSMISSGSGTAVSHNVRTGETITVGVGKMTRDRDIVISRSTKGSEGFIIAETIPADFDGSVSVENKQLMMRTSEGNKPIRVMPEQAVESVEAFDDAKPVGVNLKVKDDRPEYVISGVRKANFLAIFPVEVNVETRVDADTGEILGSYSPWWSFLAW